MIVQLERILSKSFIILGLYDLADITYSPDKIFQILNTHVKEVFAPNERIVFFTEYAPPEILLKHLYDAAQLIDIDTSFILLCTKSDIKNTIDKICASGNKFDCIKFPVKSKSLQNNFKLPDTLCPVPWASIEVRENGNIYPCCVSQIGAKVGDIQDGLQKTFTNEKMAKLRQEFMSNMKPAECNSCWDCERKELTSNRIRHRSYLLKDILIKGLNNPSISQLDLKFGKTCNFKCRICSSVTSSAFAEEEARFKKIKFVIEKNWSNDPSYLSEVIDLLPELTNIDMFGGEPWLLKSFANILQIAVDNDYAKNIRLHYNTNGSIYPKELIQFWPAFREVDIHFSIDALNERFSLERGGNWEEVESNILKIKNLNLPNIKLAVMPVISVMNILYLGEVIDWANKHDLTINPLHLTTPEPFALTQLTRDAKNLLHAKYKNHMWPEMKKILEYIEEIPDSDGKKFAELTKHFDQLRGENFADSHPEIAKAMGYVYNS